MKLHHTFIRKKISKSIATVCALTMLLNLINISVFAVDPDNEHRRSAATYSESDEFLPETVENCPFDPVIQRSFGYISTNDDELIDSSDVYSGARSRSVSSSETLPSSYDNSTSGYFPAIGDQGVVGSCTSFATAYYQYTFEINKRDNVTTTPANTCCPQFPYSYITYGHDCGSSFNENYNVLNKYGCLRYGDYNPADIDMSTEFFQFWNGDEDARIAAIQDKAVSHGTTVGNSNIMVTFDTGEDTDNALDDMKQLLNDGHLLTFGCNFNYNSMVTSTSGTNSGETIIVRGNNSGNYGHALTIVGYDDNVCVDVNGDGEIEAAESGAFKIANSWGDEWENDGFIWLLYDACNKVSQNSSSTWQASFDTTRVGFINLNTYYYIDVESRNAKLLGVVDMTTVDRYKTRVLYCSYDNENNGSNDTYYVWPYSGQPILPFDGALVFCMDSALSSIPGFPGDPFNIVIGTDNYGPYETTINSVKIIDDKGTQIISDTDSNVTIDIYDVNGNEFLRDNDFPLDFRMGDINYDWKINAVDKALLSSFIIGNHSFSTLQTFLADLNGDGRLNGTDVNLLKRLIVGG